MKTTEFCEVTRLDKVPVYRDRRYTKNLDQLSKPVYTVKKEEDVEIILRDGMQNLCGCLSPAKSTKLPL